MAVVKGLDLLVIDSNGNEVANLGRVLFPALQWTGTMLTLTSIDVTTHDSSFFESITPDYAVIGNAMPDYWPEESFQRILTIAPLSLRRNSMLYAASNYRFKFANNASGYYAISVNDIRSQGNVSGTYDLFDSEGNRLGNAAAILFPMADSAGIRCWLVNEIINGVVTSISGTLLSITFPDRTTNMASVRTATTSVTSAFLSWYNHLTVEVRPEPGDDPYTPDIPGNEPTAPGGGNGSFIIQSTPVPISPLPTFAITDAGFFSVWLPDEEQIRKIAAWMWNGKITTINFWKRMVTSPTELILGLSMLPFEISPSDSDFLRMGYINTGIRVNYTETQFYLLDFGYLAIPEVWGAYIDYNPYTSVEIFLPYIGTRRLDTDEIMNKTLHLVYKVDIISGACVATIAASAEDDHSDETVLYQFMGNCSLQVPVTAEQMVNIVRNTINLVTSIGAALGTSGSGASESGGGSQVMGHKAALVGVASSAMNLATTKQTAERTGSVSSAAGFLGQQQPYLIIKRPNKAIPANQSSYTGYPSFITETLGELSGYTEVESIHLNDIPCTEAELEEIDSALTNGVIF